jgi:hypothetical protein
MCMLYRCIVFRFSKHGLFRRGTLENSHANASWSNGSYWTMESSQHSHVNCSWLNGSCWTIESSQHSLVSSNWIDIVVQWNHHSILTWTRPEWMDHFGLWNHHCIITWATYCYTEKQYILEPNQRSMLYLLSLYIYHHYYMGYLLLHWEPVYPRAQSHEFVVPPIPIHIPPLLHGLLTVTLRTSIS